MSAPNLKTKRSRFLLCLVGTISLVYLTSSFWNDRQEDRLSSPIFNAGSNSHCKSLTPALGPYKEAHISESGDYCLKSDFWQHSLSDFAGHRGPARHHYLIGIRGVSATIDLNNFTLHSEGHSSGIVGLAFPTISQESAAGEGRYPLTVITIKNGVIDFRGLGTGIKFVEGFGMMDITDSPHVQATPLNRKVILENLLIRTDNVGIMIDGDNTVIRNCVIESAGDAAIVITGENAQISNNKITLKDPFFSTEYRNSNAISLAYFLKTKNAKKAAIVMKNAKNGVIRDNHIFVEGGSTIRYDIFLQNSFDIIIEGNTLLKGNGPSTVLLDSTAIIRNNILNNPPPRPWWQFYKNY